jgi:hypothetical protein
MGNSMPIDSLMPQRNSESFNYDASARPISFSLSNSRINNRISVDMLQRISYGQGGRHHSIVASEGAEPKVPISLKDVNQNLVNIFERDLTKEFRHRLQAGSLDQLSETPHDDPSTIFSLVNNVFKLYLRCVNVNANEHKLHSTLTWEEKTGNIT